MTFEDLYLSEALSSNREEIMESSIKEGVDKSLKQIFTPSYYRRVADINYKVEVQTKSPTSKEEGVAWWKGGDTIYVSKSNFASLKTEEKIEYILHEFIHLLIGKKNIVFISKFKEIQEIAKKLYAILKENVKTNLGLFFIGRALPNEFLNYEETLTYLMNGWRKMDWDLLSQPEKEKYIDTIFSKGVFNKSSIFWKRRLPLI